MAGADTSCSVVFPVPEGGKGADVVVETVARIGGKLASEGGGEAAAVVESLRELQGVHMTFDALEATKIGRAVNALRKSAPSEQARQLAAELYTGWKALADERFITSSRAQQQQLPAPKDDKGIVRRSSSSPPPPPVHAKQSARPEDDRDEMAPTSVVVVEATTLETQQQQKPKADEGIKKRSSSSLPPAPGLFDAKKSARPEGNRDRDREMVTVAPTSVVVVEAKPPEAKKLHLHEVSDSAADATKQRSLRIRVVNINAPGKADQRLVPVERRSMPTAVAPEPAAPASNTMRNGGGGGGANSNQQANCPVTASGHRGTNKAAAQRVSPTGAAPLTMTTAKPPAALPKPVGSSGACKRKAEATTTVFDEARLARARMRLIEGYKEASAVKEKRKTKEIKVIAGAQGKDAGRVAVRCTAAHRTGKQAPVPCPRMPRAF